MRLLRQQPQPQVLDLIGVLVLVHQDVFEALLVVRQHVAVAAQDVEHVEQQIAEVAGVQRLQPRLVQRVELLPAAIGIGLVLDRIEVFGVEPAVLPAVGQPGELARGPALLVEVVLGDQLLQQPQLIVGVDDGVVRLEPDQLGMAPQHFRPDRVEGAEPRHALYRLADMARDAFAHLARGFVGEGDAENLRGPRTARCDEMCQPCGKRGGLARARACQHQDRPFGRQDGLLLRRIELRGIGGRGACIGRDREVGLSHGCGHEQLGNAYGGSKGASEPAL